VPRKTGKRKHFPQRTCVGCKEVLPKRSLIRVVRSQEGVVVDPSGKLAGRGAYLHNRRSCWEHGLQGALTGALKSEITTKEREALMAYAASLPDEEHTMNE
jgi:uncharacterized protein